MISWLQSRRVAALVSMLALLLWAQMGVATMPISGHGPQCHDQMAGVHSTPHVMAAGCCPRHANSTLGCPAHAKLIVVAAYRPDCCAISNRPSQPVAFVVISRTVTQSAVQVCASSVLSASPTDLVGQFHRFPSFQSVFDKKADLRI